MENKLSCAIVRDIIPLYQDDLVSEETKIAVEAHLEECVECRSLSESEPIPSVPKMEEKNVDYLKKVRRRGKRRGIIALICGVVLTLAGFTAKYYTGTEADPEDVSCIISVSESTENTVKIRAVPVSDKENAVRIVFSDSNGIVNAKVYTSPKLFFGKSEKEAEYVSPVSVERVTVGDCILWENGMNVSLKAARLFAAKNPFVGDMPGNLNISEILEVAKDFGGFESELLTEEAPYTWIIRPKKIVTEAERDFYLKKMTADSCVFLALIDNLDAVTWEYYTESGKETVTVSRWNISQYLAGKDIKEYGESATSVDLLLNLTGLG